MPWLFISFVFGCKKDLSIIGPSCCFNHKFTMHRKSSSSSALNVSNRSWDCLYLVHGVVQEDVNKRFDVKLFTRINKYANFGIILNQVIHVGFILCISEDSSIPLSTKNLCFDHFLELTLDLFYRIFFSCIGSCARSIKIGKLCNIFKIFCFINWTHMLSGRVSILQPYFARKAALTSFVFLPNLCMKNV